MAVRLDSLTTLRLGGPADRFIQARSREDLVAAVRDADAAGEPLVVLAGGSNVVAADEGVRATVVHVGSRGVTRSDGADGRVVLEIEAGEEWDAVVESAVAEGLAGIECLSGIPGSVGATPIQNVGAYGQEIAESIAAVTVLARADGAVQELAPVDCGFSYRSSAFKREPGRQVVLSVTLALKRSPVSRPIRYGELADTLGVTLGDRAALGEVRDAVLALRRSKGMVVDPADPDSISAGSFFTNPILDPGAFAALERRVAERLGAAVRAPAWLEQDGRTKTSAAWLVERAGFSKGYGDPDGIAVSSKHTLALTNRGRGTAAQLVALAREIATGVVETFGVELVPEPVFVGHAWPGVG